MTEGPATTPGPVVPPLRSRVLAGVLGGASALTVTVSLAIAQSGGAATPAARGGAHHAAAASAATAAPPASASAAAAPRPVDPGGVQARRTPVTSAAPASALAAGGIPATALAAYRGAAVPHVGAPCHLPWALLAGIGRVESDHGRFAGAVLHTDGVSTPAIVGIALNGHGTEVVRDTDHGRLDGDTVYDRAVGPMQFIPSTWAIWGADGNHDGIRDPFNLYDAAAAAAAYLCAAGGDLGTATGQRTAVLNYNHSTDYLNEVLGLEKLYAAQYGLPIPALPAPPKPSTSVAAPRAPVVPAGPTGFDPAAPAPPGAPGTTRPPSGPISTRPPTSAPPSSGPSTPPTCPPTSPSPTPSGSPTASPSPTPTPSPSGGSSSTPGAPSSSDPCAPSTTPGSPTS